MEVATRRCFIERSVQFEEDQLYDTHPSTQEGITISPPIFYEDDVLHVLDSDEEDHIKHDPVIETKSQEILDLDPVTIPNQKPKPKWAQNFLMQLEVVLELQKTKEELGPSIRMSMLHYLSQILSLYNGAAKFQVGAT